MRSPDELDDLIGAYVLDAVDDDERAEVEAAIAADPLLRAEVERLRAAFDEVLDTQVAGDGPRHDLWGRIEAQLEDRPAIALTSRPGGAAAAPDVADEGSGGAALAPVVPLTRPAGRRRAPLLLAIAAAVLVVLGIGGVLWARRPADLRSEAEVALALPGAREGVLSSTGGGAGTLEVVVDPTGHAYALFTGLPAAPSGHEYQMWAVDGTTPVSLGVMGDGTHDASMALPAAPPGTPPATRLAVTVEPLGGSPAPTTTPVLVGQLT